MLSFVAGAICFAYLTAGLFFLKFWKETHDRLFAMFSIAFGVLAANRALLALLREVHEARSWLYFVRLLAFVLILLAILDKNRAQPR
jgi:thiosulfate reductase cytochrome b subunit